MKLSQKYSLTNDLQDSLITIFENSELTFIWEQEKLHIDDVFKTNCLLPIFLYDKQRFVNKFCSDKFNNKYFAQVILKQSPESILNFVVHIEHNFNKKEQYNLFIKFLISLILIDSCFGSKTINLDDKFNNFQNTLIQSFSQEN